MHHLKTIASAVALGLLTSAAIAQTNPSQAVLEEVLVTATKRAGVSAQDVPISITVIDEEALTQANIQSMTDLTRLSASLIAVEAQNVAATRIGLRGLSTSANNIGFEAAVGVSIDGVPRGRTGLALSEMPQLDSVEVLRGPQGTLFGRNTTAGVININTARPDPDGGGFFDVQAGNYDAITAQGAVNLPINDAWTARLDGKYRERDGFLDDLNSGTDLNTIDRASVRGQLTFGGESSDLRLIADWAEDQSICCGSMFFEQNFNNPLFSLLAGQQGRVGYGSANPDDLENALSRRPTNDISEWGISAEYNRDVGNNRFTSITAYRDWESFAESDGDQSGADLATRDNFSANTVFTQEFRLQGETGSINWMIGAFYLHDEVESELSFSQGTQWAQFVDLNLASAAGIQAFGSLPSSPGQPGFTPSLLAAVNPALATTYLPPASAVTNNIDQTTNAFAIFTDNEIALSDTITATIGLRYTNEEKELDYVFSSTDSGSPLEACRIAPAFTGTPLAQLSTLLCPPNVNILFDGTDKDTISYDAFSGTAKLAWAVTDDLMLYSSYSRGFKAGGFNFDRVTITLEDGGGSVEDLAFDEEIVDAYEIGWNSTLADGNVTFNGALFFQDVQDFQQVIFNGVNFEVAQGDFESKGLELDLTATPFEALMLNANYAYTDAENTSTGERPLAQPENTLSVAATLFVPLGESMTSSFHLNARYQDEIALTSTLAEDAYTTLNGRIALKPKNGAWEVAIWGQNLSDENRLTVGFPAVLNGAGGNSQGFINMPRTYGAEVRYSF